MDRPLTAREASVYLRLTEGRVRTLCKEGKLRATKSGNAYLIFEDAIEEYQNRKSGKEVKQDEGNTGKDIRALVEKMLAGDIGAKDEFIEEYSRSYKVGNGEHTKDLLIDWMMGERDFWNTKYVELANKAGIKDEDTPEVVFVQGLVDEVLEKCKNKGE